MNLIIPDSKKQTLADALGFVTFDAAVAAVKGIPLNEYGYAEIRKGGGFIQRTSNKNSYASIIVGGGKAGMSQDWAASDECLTVRGRKIANGIPA